MRRNWGDFEISAQKPVLSTIPDYLHAASSSAAVFQSIIIYNIKKYH